MHRLGGAQQDLPSFRQELCKWHQAASFSIVIGFPSANLPAVLEAFRRR
jgi:hypothetical protein